LPGRERPAAPARHPEQAGQGQYRGGGDRHRFTGDETAGVGVTRIETQGGEIRFGDVDDAIGAPVEQGSHLVGTVQDQLQAYLCAAAEGGGHVFVLITAFIAPADDFVTEFIGEQRDQCLVIHRRITAVRRHVYDAQAEETVGGKARIDLETAQDMAASSGTEEVGAVLHPCSDGAVLPFGNGARAVQFQGAARFRVAGIHAQNAIVAARIRPGGRLQAVAEGVVEGAGTVVLLEFRDVVDERSEGRWTQYRQQQGQHGSQGNVSDHGVFLQ